MALGIFATADRAWDGDVAMGARIDLRSYRGDYDDERHGFAQIVLPVAGVLDIDVCGTQHRLCATSGAVILPGNRHCQQASGTNHALVVDIDIRLIEASVRDRFEVRPFVDISPRLFTLLRELGGSLGSERLPSSSHRLFADIVVSSLAGYKPTTALRLARVKHVIDAAPFTPWTVSHLATVADLSISRLHALCVDYFGMTPHDLLVQARMRELCHLLETSSIPLADLAVLAGYSDQTALTRAMRTSLGVTPAAYRRQARL